MALAVTLAAAAALLAAFWLFLSWNFNYWKERGVVSCNPFSLTGDRGGGLSFGKSFYAQFDDLYRRYKGKERFVGTFLARRPALVVLDLELIKTVMTREFSQFPGRGLARDERDELSRNLFFLDGPRWKNLRAKLSPVFTSGKLKGMFPLMVDTTEQLNGVVRAAAAKGNQEVEMQETLMRYSTDVIGSVAFGMDCNTLTGGNDEFLTMSRQVFSRNLLFLVRFFLVSVHPVFATLIPFKLVFGRITRFFVGLMKDTVEHCEKNAAQRNDFVQLMMQLREEDRVRSPEDRANHVHMDHGTMAAQAFLFFIAGLDNIVNTVGFALHELALNPALQQRAVDEVRNAKAKHGSLMYEAMRDLDLVERIIQEALRKYVPIGVLFRQPGGAFKLPDSDVQIDPRALVLIPVWALMHDPAIFPEPDRFDPDRFTEEAKQARHGYAYLPFGEGPRFCIAERFAMLEMKLCLAALLDQHAFSVGSKTTVPMQLEPGARAPKPLDGFWLRVDDRQK